MIVRIELTPQLRDRCLSVARERDAIKAPHTDRRICDRPGWQIHFLGLLGEAGVAEYFDCAEAVDYSVQRHGDGGRDIVLGGLDCQVKASRYMPPWLRFDRDGPQTFKADIAIVTRVPTSSVVEIWGYATRAEFMRSAAIQNMGYGPKLVLKRLRSITDLRIDRRMAA